MASFHKMIECGKDKGFLLRGNCALQHQNWNFKTRDEIDFLTLFEVFFYLKSKLFTVISACS